MTLTPVSGIGSQRDSRSYRGFARSDLRSLFCLDSGPKDGTGAGARKEGQMKNARRLQTASGCMLAGLVLTGFGIESARATQFAWAPPTDTNALFSYSNGRNEGDANLLQTPTLTGFGFDFDKTLDFRSEGGGGITQSTANLAFAELLTVAGSLDSITVREWGTYSIGAGQDPYEVLTLDSAITLQVFLAGPPFLDVTQFDVDQAFLVFNPDGTWEARGTLVPGVGTWNDAWLTVSNTLVVESTAAAGSFFTKDGMQVVIPEPACLGLMLAGAIPFLRRRRN